MNSFHQAMLDLSFPFYKREDVKLTQRLGAGYTGEVYSGELTIFDDMIDCVVKKVCSSNYEKGSSDKVLYQDIIDEVTVGHRFMSKSNHQIQFYGYSVFRKQGKVIIYLIMEQTDAMGDLHKYLYADKLWSSLSEEEYHNSSSNTVLSHEGSYWDYIHPNKDKLNIIYQMCLAVQDLHTFNIVHCDLKPHNMLFTEGKVKLIDYNGSQDMGTEREIQGPAEMGTPGYMAKEMYDGWISYQADIYSIGVTMLEIWFGDIWSTESEDYNVCRKHTLDYLALLRKDNIQLHKLIKKCISTEPNKRPLIKSVLSSLDHILLSQGIVE